MPVPPNKISFKIIFKISFSKLLQMYKTTEISDQIRKNIIWKMEVGTEKQFF